MYYVIQVTTGEESRIREMIRVRLTPSEYGEVFYPLRLVRKKLRGEWRDVHQRLLPGYLFLTTEDPENLFLALKRVPAMTKLLGRDGENFQALSEKDVEWLEWLLGVCERSETNAYTNYEVGLSYVIFNERDEVVVAEGPLRGMEGIIKKINLHRRTAEIETTFMNRKQRLILGIEFLEKK